MKFKIISLSLLLTFISCFGMQQPTEIYPVTKLPADIQKEIKDLVFNLKFQPDQFGGKETILYNLQNYLPKQIEKLFKAFGYTKGIENLIYQHIANEIKKDFKQSDINEALLSIVKGSGLRKTSLPIAKILIKAGADVNAKDTYSGESLLEEAAEWGSPEIIVFLVENGAKVTGRALSKAILSKRGSGSAKAKILIEKGADLKSTYLGKTPIETAARVGDEDTMKLIEQKMGQ